MWTDAHQQALQGNLIRYFVSLVLRLCNSINSLLEWHSFELDPCSLD